MRPDLMGFRFSFAVASCKRSRIFGRSTQNHIIPFTPVPVKTVDIRPREARQRKPGKSIFMPVEIGSGPTPPSARHASVPRLKDQSGPKRIRSTRGSGARATGGLMSGPRNQVRESRSDLDGLHACPVTRRRDRANKWPSSGSSLPRAGFARLNRSFNPPYLR